MDAPETKNLNSYSLNLHDMWNLYSKEESNLFGLPGYQVPKIYFDPKKQKYDREMEQLHHLVWKGKDHYPSPKFEKDSNGKDILPKRPNYMDELLKFNKSNFSQKKYDEYIEKLKSKGLTIEEIEGTKQRKKSGEKDNPNKNSFFFKVERKTYLDDIVRSGIKKNQISPEMKELITKVKEKQSKYSSIEKNVENSGRIFNSHLK